MFTEKADMLEKFRTEFTSWIAQHPFCFVGLVDENQLNRSRIFGKVDEEKIFVLTAVFDEFCAQKGIEKKALLKKLEAENLLIKKTHERMAVPVKILGVVSSCYCFYKNILPS